MRETKERERWEKREERETNIGKRRGWRQAYPVVLVVCSCFELKCYRTGTSYYLSPRGGREREMRETRRERPIQEREGGGDKLTLLYLWAGVFVLPNDPTNSTCQHTDSSTYLRHVILKSRNNVRSYTCIWAWWAWSRWWDGNLGRYIIPGTLQDHLCQTLGKETNASVGSKSTWSSRHLAQDNSMGPDLRRMRGMHVEYFLW